MFQMTQYISAIPGINPELKLEQTPCFWGWFVTCRSAHVVCTLERESTHCRQASATLTALHSPLRPWLRPNERVVKRNTPKHVLFYSWNLGRSHEITLFSATFSVRARAAQYEEEWWTLQYRNWSEMKLTDFSSIQRTKCRVRWSPTPNVICLHWNPQCFRTPSIMPRRRSINKVCVMECVEEMCHWQLSVA